MRLSVDLRQIAHFRILLAAAAVCVCAAAAIAQTAAQELFFRHEFRVEFEAVDPLVPRYFDPAERAKLILEEARWVYAGMTRGYSFSYIPYDARRKIQEAFTMTTQGEIPWADPSITGAETRVEGNYVYAYVEYRPPAREALLRESWDSAAYPRCQGAGEAAAQGWKARFDAIKDACRMAIREYARTVELNKPREVTGKFVFDVPPSVSLQAGRYLARVKLRLSIGEIRSYEVY